MRCLIRYVTRQSKSGVVYQDKVFTGKTLALGRAVDQPVFLSDPRAALRHALITDLLDGRFLLQSKSPSGVRINDRLSQSSPVRPGDRINIGNSEIRVMSPPEGFDLAVEVETKQARLVEGRLLHQLPRLGGAMLRTRGLSWLLFSAILLLFLGIPAASVYLDDYYSPLTNKIQEWLSTEEEFYELPKMPLLISDRFWNSGELASAHHFFRQECDVCHQEPFKKVSDQYCINCHRKTHPHVDPQFFDLETLNNTRCAECHKDHNGKRALVRRDDSLCSDCHKDLSKQGVNTQLGDASDFGTDHPPFKPTLITYADGQETSRRVSMEDRENFRENSNLEFPHSIHVSRDGLSTIDGVFYLWCDDCHTHEAGSPDMEPVNYYKHCQRCHPLTFEPSDPYREVPHGKVAEVMYTLQDYYGNRALEGNYPDATAPEVVQRRRFPGEELSPDEMLVALNWAREKAEEIGEEVFEFSVCIDCHKVELTQRDPPRWSVLPVRLAQDWMPKGYYTHEKHKTMKCLFCHAAPESEFSSDILLPHIGTCQACHGGIHATDKLQSTCVDCHSFHVAGEFTMGAEQE